MKWEKPNGSTQMTSCGNFCIVQANSQDWIAYRLTPFGTGEQLGERKSDVDARQCCEDAQSSSVSPAPLKTPETGKADISP